MKVAIASDHAGFALKEVLREKLAAEGYQVADYGTTNTESTDYPDYAQLVAQEVANGHADCGILVCFTGIGMSISANKVNGIRAALAPTVDAARLTREHNDANVLAIGAKYTDPKLAAEIVDAFLTTEFQGGRHARRVAKISQIEGLEKAK